ncbi:MAG: hypothetical protein JXA21_16855 [Anaerolineae bacterium]|nr:hypothetical protein [Anaerolineae bacterium]
MDVEKENSLIKMDYVKPVIVNLGPVTIALGADNCYGDGSAPTLGCGPGSVASTTCQGNGGSATLGSCIYYGIAAPG